MVFVSRVSGDLGSVVACTFTAMHKNTVETQSSFAD